MNENKRTLVKTNLPSLHEWHIELETLFDVLNYPIVLKFDPELEVLINTNNIYFKCDAPNGKAIVAACNALFRSLLNLSMALGEYDNGN